MIGISKRNGRACLDPEDDNFVYNFVIQCGERGDRFELSKPQQLRLLEAGEVQAWNLYRKYNPDAHIDLSGCDFGGLDLWGVNFAHADLSDTSFHESILIEADFKFSKISQANFNFSRLFLADFTGVDTHEARGLTKLIEGLGK